jgi:hypothetical protein
MPIVQDDGILIIAPCSLETSYWSFYLRNLELRRHQPPATFALGTKAEQEWLFNSAIFTLLCFSIFVVPHGIYNPVLDHPSSQSLN